MLPKYLILFLFALVSMQMEVRAETQKKAITDGYLLQEGDVLEISVWKEDGLARELMVSPDGSVSFPLIGQLTARGMTVSALEKEISRRIAAFIPEPSVSVVLKTATGSKFYVIGKVNKPGEFQLLGPVSVLQALSIAGGTSTFADFDSIKIIRHENGVDTAIRFRYGDIEEGEKLSQNILLKSGDVVVVP